VQVSDIKLVSATDLPIRLCQHYKTWPDQVFIDAPDFSWRRVSTATVERRGWQGRVVRCSEIGCTNPAVQLDHLYPYDATYTRCAEHLEASR
jgi:hypothetical protein